MIVLSIAYDHILLSMSNAMPHAIGQSDFVFMFIYFTFSLYHNYVNGLRSLIIINRVSGKRVVEIT
jgi:hypothetical protein